MKSSDTYDLFKLYPITNCADLQCRLCGGNIECVVVNDNDQCYRCTNVDCTRHYHGEMVDIEEYPDHWVTRILPSQWPEVPKY